MSIDNIATDKFFYQSNVILSLFFDIFLINSLNLIDYFRYYRQLKIKKQGNKYPVLME